jgi:hypothetical protein
MAFLDKEKPKLFASNKFALKIWTNESLQT